MRKTIIILSILALVVNSYGQTTKKQTKSRNDTMKNQDVTKEERFAQNPVTIINCDDVVKATNLLEEVTYRAAIETIIRDKIETCSKEKRNMTLVAAKYHPFVFAVHTAYSQHRPLIISPDMIWLLICQGFTKHVNYHSEELRHKFVQFSDKRKIKIATENFNLNFHKGSPDNPWELVFSAFSDSINECIGSDFAELMVSNFTTTTPTDKAAFEITLMDAMDSYLDYWVSTLCGIPQIYLEGSLNDWEKIKENIQKLRGYKIDYWINSLDPIIDEFIKAKKGKINNDFWQSIYKLNNQSGGPYITGWIIKFFPYLNSNEHKLIRNKYINTEPKGDHSGLTSKDFFSGISQADFVWDYIGTEYEMEFVAGFIGVKQDKATLTLRPEIGWAVKDKKKNNNNKNPR